MSEAPVLDLRAYLERVGCEAPGKPSFQALAELHLGHLRRIPFENVDVFLGRPGGLDLPSLQAKLVGNCRGGYCFEQNTLFAAVLRALGFEVGTLEARVRPAGATALLPRTHMVLKVDLGGRAYVADVGFGGTGPLVPVPLDGTPDEQPDGVYRVDREGDGVHVLRARRTAAWEDLYAFTLAPAEPVDFEVAHHYTSTHPRSRFVLTLTVQRSEPQVRHILRGRTYSVVQGGAETTREVADDEFPPLLDRTFGLRLSDSDVRELLHRTRTP